MFETTKVHQNEINSIFFKSNSKKSFQFLISFKLDTGYLFYISADQYYGEWVELFADGYNDTDIEVITHDLRVLLEELEFFAQWMVRDAEDLVHPWVNYTSREVMDSYVFNYTFAAGEIIEITGQTTFRTYKIVEEAYYVSFFNAREYIRPIYQISMPSIATPTY